MSTFTSAQQAAITARGNVVVMAGAGTGKTRTLIERCRQLLRAGASLDQMLLVTFTEAAAAEMRARLRKSLQAELEEKTAPHDDRLAEQLALLDTAQISTLHSFCLRLIRENFHALAIDPQLVILDERQTRPLARDCLTGLLAEHYAGRHPSSTAVQQLIRRAGRGSDEPLRTLVGKLHRYAQTLPDPEAWFTAQLARFGEPTPRQWKVWLSAGFEAWRADWLTALAAAPDVPALKLSAAALRQVPPVPQDSGEEVRPERLRTIAAALNGLLAADSAEHWARKKTLLRPAFARLFADAEFLNALLGPDGTATALAEDWEWSRHNLAALVELTRQFTARFGEAKRQLGGLDFADLEQFALRLLRDDSTGVARQCRARFAHICVDEYQDINAAQDAILRLVGGQAAQANRFLVGDLKQSIYRFRLANPRIFAAYAQAWRTEQAASPTAAQRQSVIALADNFRSHEAILNFVNPLFRSLMRTSIGGVAYDAEAELKAGHGHGPTEVLGVAEEPAPRVELHVLTKELDEPADESDSSQDLSDLLAIEREARCVALRLRELHDQGHAIWDEETKALRPVAWRDMVVLLRSPGSRGESFAQEFHRAKVPLHAQRGGFYEALEVSDLLNLLRLLDNPLQDLPLLAVLRSPLVGMTLEELVTLRANHGQRLWWDALIKFRAAPLAGAAGTTWAKTAEFLERFTLWRGRLRLGSLTDCLESVLTETHYEALLLAEPRGAERSANVRRLLDLARQFDPYQRQGLHRFLQFITAQTEAELDHDPAPTPTDNAVRLMSIHQSKGLEFPVVVVAGLGTLFNERDLRGDILLDDEHGLCPMVSPTVSERHYPSLPHWLAQRRGRRELLGEELRLLYVALTRARDTLLLAGTDAGKEVVEQWRGPATPMDDLALLKARRPLDWLRRWLPCVTKEDDWRGDESGQNDLLGWRFYTADDARLATVSPKPPPRVTSPAMASLGDRAQESSSPHQDSGPEEEALVASLRAKLTQPYPHELATHELAKTSVTVLRRLAMEAEEEVRLFQPPVAGPRRMKGTLSAAQTGLAHHAFLQCVDLERTATALDLRNEAARLVRDGVLSEQDAKALDFAALLSFWESAVGQQVRKHAATVQREVPFTARFTVPELGAMQMMAPPAVVPPGKQGNEEFVVVQGVADLIVLGEREIWLLDYKTDHFDEAELPMKLREYGPQLTLYALALERIYGLRVTRTWLHFLTLGRTELL